jgi:orotidine-5'-phosphate decarboxylase
MHSPQAADYTMNPSPAARSDRLIVALDVPTADEALALVQALGGDIAIFKVGLQLYTAAGPQIVRAITATGARVFLDLKLHDIPNTVASAVAAAGELGVAMLTLHLAGGRAMLEAAVKRCPTDLLLLGVTVLTSSDESTLRETGVTAGVSEQVLRLAALGQQAGIGGLIASPHELRPLRNQLGAEMTIITPGVRPTWAAANDQKRFTTPAEALNNGADYLVIGRPITAHPDPREAVRKIISEIQEGVSASAEA